MDIPLDDPEANRAAAKIQAGFRGHMTRKKLKPEDKAEGEEVSGTESLRVDLVRMLSKMAAVRIETSSFWSWRNFTLLLVKPRIHCGGKQL